MTPAARAAVVELVAAARRVALDHVDDALVPVFVRGLVEAGVENPETLGRVLVRAGIVEARWPRAGEGAPA